MNKITNKNSPLIIVFIIIILLILYFILNNSNQDNNIAIDNKTINNQESKEATDITKYNLQKVAEHNNRNDCWTVIRDKVYDITNFIPKHEGGEIITQLCGIDGTETFNKQHSGQSKPMRVLQKLFMGLYEK